MKKLLLTIVWVVALINLSAQTTGDYRTKGAAAFSSPTNWETYNGTSWVAAPYQPSGNGTGVNSTSFSCTTNSSSILTLNYGTASTTVPVGFIKTGMYVTGSGIPTGTTIVTYPYNGDNTKVELSQSATSGTSASFTFQEYIAIAGCATTLSSASVTNVTSASTYVVQGMAVSGTGMPSTGATVQSVSGTTVTLVSGTGVTAQTSTSLTFYSPNISVTFSSGSTTLTLYTANTVLNTLVNTNGVKPTIKGTAIPAGTYITAYDNTAKTITISQPTTNSSSGTGISFGNIVIPNLYVNHNTNLGTNSWSSTIGNIYVNNATLSIGDASTNAEDLVCSTITIASGATLNTNSNTNAKINTLEITGGIGGNALTNNGTIDLTTTTGNQAATTLTVTTPGATSISSGSTINTYGFGTGTSTSENLTLGSALNCTGSLTIGAGSTLTDGGYLITVAGNISGTGTHKSTTANGNGAAGVSGGLKLTGTGATASQTFPALTSVGNIWFAGGSFNYPISMSSSTGSNFQTGCSFHVDAGAYVNLGQKQWTMSATGNYVTINGTVWTNVSNGLHGTTSVPFASTYSPTVTFGSSSVVYVTAATPTITGANYGTLIVNANASFTLGRTSYYNFGISGDLIINCNTATAPTTTSAQITFNGSSGTQTFAYHNANASPGLLTIPTLIVTPSSGNTTVKLATNNPSTVTSIAATTLTVSSGGTLDMSALALTTTTPTISGTLITGNTSATPFPASKAWGGTVQFNNTQNKVTTYLTSSNNTIYLSAADVTIAPGQIVTGNGIPANTTVSSYTYTASVTTQAASSSGNATQQPYVTLSAANASIAVGQIVTGTGIQPNTVIVAMPTTTILVLSQPTGTTSPANATLTFSSAAVVLSNNATATGLNTLTFSTSGGQTVPTSTSFNNLTINNANAVSLAATTPVNGNLTLAAGTLNNSTNNITLGNSATIINSGGTLSAAPTFGTSVNLTYIGSSIKGVEFPAADIINTLTVNNTGGITLADNRNIPNLSVANGSSLTVNAGNQLTVSTSMTNNGTLNLLSNASSGTATILTPPTISGTTGTVSVQQYLPDARNWYVSSPVSNASAPSGYTYYQYDETGNHSSDPAGPYWFTPTGNLNAGTGYIALPSATGSTLTFATNGAGTLNYGNKDVTLTKSGTGFNLIGNPYPCHLGWTYDFVNANSTLIEPSIWIRTNAGTTNNSGQWSFVTYNATSSQSVPSVANGGIIPPMQGFWVKALAAGTLTLDDKLTHTHQSSNPLKVAAMKNTTSQDVRLQVTNGTYTDELLVYFNPNASNGYDAFDSPKFTDTSAALQIYSTVDNQQLVINGMNSVPLNTEIPLEFKNNASGTFSIRASELNLTDATLDAYLYDHQTGQQQDLSVNPVYNFTLGSASTSHFGIVFKSPTSVTALQLTDNNTGIYSDANQRIVVNIPDVAKRAQVTVYNAIGQPVWMQSIFSAGNVLNALFTPGIYMVQVDSNLGQITRKLIIK